MSPIVMIYFHTKNEGSRSIGSNVIWVHLLLWYWPWPVTLTPKLDLHIVMTYFHTKIRLISSNVPIRDIHIKRQMDRQTDGQTEMCKTFTLLSLPGGNCNHTDTQLDSTKASPTNMEHSKRCCPVIKRSILFQMKLMMIIFQHFAWVAGIHGAKKLWKCKWILKAFLKPHKKT